MRGPGRLLIVGGLMLAIWGMSYGLYYAVFIEHQTLEHIGGLLAGGFVSAARGELSAAHQALESYQAASAVYTRQVDVHSHWIGLAMVLVAIGAAFHRLPFSRRIGLLIASALLIGSAVFPLGVMLETVGPGAAPKAIAVAGVTLVTAALAVVALGFARRGGQK
jgi:hypothetical protein